MTRSALLAPVLAFALAGASDVPTATVTVTLVPATISATVGDRDTVIATVRRNGTICPTCLVTFRVLDTTRLRLVSTFIPKGQKKANGAVLRALKAGTPGLRGGNSGVADTTRWTIIDSTTTPPDTTTPPRLIAVSIIVRPDSAKVDTSATVQFCSAFRMADDSIRISKVSQGVPGCLEQFSSMPGFASGAAYQVASAETPGIHLYGTLLPDSAHVLVRAIVVNALWRDGEWVLIKPLKNGSLVS